MKIIKYNEDELQKIELKFKDYISKLKEGDKVKFEYEPSKEFTKPKLIVSQVALMKMRSLVQNCGKEIGWNGTAVRIDGGYKIEDIYVYPQRVTAATVVCDEIETANWLTNLPEGVWEKLKFQGHSHVNMGITPSGTDETMYSNYLNQLGDDDFMIFMIMNKSDNMYLQIIDKRDNKIYYKSDIDYIVEGMDDFWEESKSQLKEIKPEVNNYSYSYSYTSNRDDNKPYVIPECKNDCSTCKKDIKRKCMEYWMSEVQKEFYNGCH